MGGSFKLVSLLLPSRSHASLFSYSFFFLACLLRGGEAFSLIPRIESRLIVIAPVGEFEIELAMVFVSSDYNEYIIFNMYIVVFYHYIYKNYSFTKSNTAHRTRIPFNYNNHRNQRIPRTIKIKYKNFTRTARL